MQKITPQELLTLKSKLAVLDVRTPAEYERGHIPGAINLPLFSNDERVVIGTLYKQKGRDIAVQKGLEIVGPKLASISLKAKKLAHNKEIILHCWRGGMRSGSVGWLLQTAGLQPKVLIGGYKAYRQEVHRVFSERKLNLQILGGRTGSGKTLILHALRQKGHQILDLEQLANHKGSSFGAIGEDKQPVTEYFENLLHDAILQLDPNKVTWVENESRGIGRVYIPEGFWNQMKIAPLLHISIPTDERLKILTQMYVNHDKELLASAFERIRTKIGGLNYKIALDALQQGDYSKAASLALGYYDKAYDYGFAHNETPSISSISFDYFDAHRIADEILAL